MEKFVRSEKGFWIGSLWAAQQNMIDRANKRSGKFLTITDNKTGLRMLIYKIGCDGIYYDEDGQQFVIDSASICLIPLELVEDTNFKGRIFEGAGAASMDYFGEDMFGFTLPSGKTLVLS